MPSCPKSSAGTNVLPSNRFHIPVLVLLSKCVTESREPHISIRAFFSTCADVDRQRKASALQADPCWRESSRRLCQRNCVFGLHNQQRRYRNNKLRSFAIFPTRRDSPIFAASHLIIAVSTFLIARESIEQVSRAW